MDLKEKFFVYENIHTTKKKLDGIEWIKAPYRYRFKQRVLGCFAILISIIMMTLSGLLFVYSWQDTTEKQYHNLITQHVQNFVRDLINNADLNAEEEQEEHIKKDLLNFLKVHNKEETDLSLDENNLFSKLDNMDILSKLQIPDTDDNSQDALQSVLDRSNSQSDKKGASALSHFNYLTYIAGKDKNEYFQIEGSYNFLSSGIENSKLHEYIHLPYPFFILLYYSQGPLPTVTNPYIDMNAPIHLLTSHAEILDDIVNFKNHYNIFNIKKINERFNVIFNLEAGFIKVNDQYLTVNFKNMIDDKDMQKVLRSYFSSDILRNILLNSDLRSRKPNLIIAMQIDDKNIYALDKRPVLTDGPLYKNFIYAFNQNYNAISRAKYTGKMLPIIAAVFIFSLIAYIVFFARLCAYAGYISNRHGEIPKNSLPSALFKLSWFDYLPLEILLLLTLLSYGLTLLPGILIYKIIIFVHIFFIVNTTVVLSLIRRYRGNVLLTHSIFYFMLNIFMHMRANWRWSIMYLISVFSLLFAIQKNSKVGIAFILAVIFLVIFAYTVDMEHLRYRLASIVGNKLRKPKEISIFRPLYIKEINKDVDEIEKLLLSSKSKELKSEKLKTELITNVSHDLKTPLTAIVNYANLLRKGDNNEAERAEYIERIYHNGMRLQTLTENLIEASKAASGVLPVEMMQLDLNDFLKQICGEWLDRFNEADIQLNYRIYDKNGEFCNIDFNYLPEENSDKEKFNLAEMPLYVDTDPNHLVRILENLMANCLKYSLKGSRVFLNLKCMCQNRAGNETLDSLGAVVPIIDSQESKVKAGQIDSFMQLINYKEKNNDKTIDDCMQSYVQIELVNISNQKINLNTEQLLERFIQGDVSRQSEGAGLGLSIVKSLADLMKIHFEVKLEDDKFKVSLIFKKKSVI